MSFSAANDSSKAAQSQSKPRTGAGLSRSKSAESLQKLGQERHKSQQQQRPLPAARLLQKTEVAKFASNAREVSRVELLLAQKRSKQHFKPAVGSSQGQKVNKAIKLSAQWTDVQKAVTQTGGVSPGNAAYALHRLGCLHSFSSRKRQAELAASGLVPHLVDTSASGIETLDAGSVALFMDGCARLHHVPPTPVLNSLVACAQRMAPAFESSQLPLVLWAFAVLQFVPPSPLLSAFDQATPLLAASMSPQSVCLTLSGFQAAQYAPSQLTKDCLAASLYRMLPICKPSELATCLEAFSFFDYELAEHIVEAIMNQRRNEDSNVDWGKPSLAQNLIAQSQHDLADGNQNPQKALGGTFASKGAWAYQMQA